MNRGEKRPMRMPIVYATEIQVDGRTEVVESVVGYEDPVCNKCKKVTTSHLDHDGLTWCHRCWLANDMDRKEREWKEEKERLAKAKAEAWERKQLEEEVARNAKLKLRVQREAEASFDQAVIKAAEKVGAEVSVDELPAPPAELLNPTLCDKCGKWPAVDEYPLEENEMWDEKRRDTALLCAECVREVIPKEYDEED